jgi:hypothetical protein
MGWVAPGERQFRFVVSSVTAVPNRGTHDESAGQAISLGRARRRPGLLQGTHNPSVEGSIPAGPTREHAGHTARLCSTRYMEDGHNTREPAEPRIGADLR